MSDPKTDQRGQDENPNKRPDTTDIPDQIDLSIYDIDVSEPFGFGDGSLRENPKPDPGGSNYKIGQNPIREGAGTERVRDLQLLLISELDGSGQTNHPSEVLPNFGVDGVWRCETQQAFNRLLKEKGMEDLCNSGGKTVAETEGVRQKSVDGCGGIKACQLTQEVLDALKEKKIEESIVEEEPDPTERTSIGDQCFLIKNIAAVILESTPPENVSFFDMPEDETVNRFNLKYKNIHKLRTEDPATIMNRLRITKGALELLNIRHWQQSQLTPTIRIYKEYREGPLKDPVEVEMDFSTFVDPIKDLQVMLENQTQRGVGVGIKSFDFSFQGISPATSKLDIEAEINIFAQNFNELFKTRQGVDQNGKPFKGGYRIIDLVTSHTQPLFIERQDKNTKLKSRVYNPNFFELKVRAGWAATGGGGVISDDLAAAIKDNQVEMFLGYTGHDFDFNDDGSVNLKITFRARPDTVLQDKKSDVLFDPEVLRQREERREKIQQIIDAKKELKEQNKPCEDDSITQLQELYRKNVDREREKSYRSLLTDLTKEGCIYTAEISDGLLKSSEGNAAEGALAPFVVKNYSCGGGDGLLELASKEPGIRRINYVFLGDVLALAINNVLTRRFNEAKDTGRLNYGNTKFVFCAVPVNIRSGRTSSRVMLDITNIPISVELLTEFLNEKVIMARKNSYPLMSFLKDVIKDLLFEAVAPDCLGGEDFLNINLDTATISADSAAGGKDPIALRIEEDGTTYLDLDRYAKNLSVPPEESNGIFGIPGALRRKTNPNQTKFVFDSFNRKSLSESFEYTIVYPYNVEARNLTFDPDSKFKSRYEKDLSNGLFHFTTGLDRGLVKSMKFSKTEIKGLREARFFQLENEVKDLQLAEVYNCNLTMFGNNLLFPGTIMYINPRGLGSDLIGDPGTRGTYANTMGLGGYHNVISVRHSINPTGYEVTVRAMYETSGDGLGSNITRENKIGDSAILECVDIEKQIDELAADLGGSIDRGGS